jgi:ferrous iron transport protein B
MIFSLLAAPCMATVAVTRKESGSWGWALAQFFGLTATGYLITLLIYQIGSAIIAMTR